jgi:hypothetical protein
MLLIDGLIRGLPEKSCQTDAEFVGDILAVLRRTTCRDIPEKILSDFGRLLQASMPRCPHCRRVYPTWVVARIHCKNCARAPHPRGVFNRRRIERPV